MMPIAQFLDIVRFYSRVQPRFAPDFNDPMVQRWWYETFNGFEKNALRRAMDELAQSLDHFPSPKHVLERLGAGQATPEGRANELPHLIWAALERHGSRNSWDQIEQDIGADGAVLVERLGGWLHLCETVETRNKTTHLAQWRELARHITPELVRAHLERRNQPALPRGSSVAGLIAAAADQVASLKPADKAAARERFAQFRREVAAERAKMDDKQRAEIAARRRRLGLK